MSPLFLVSHDYRKLWGFLPGCSRVYIYTCMLCQNICLKSWEDPILCDSIIFTGTISPRPNPHSSRRCIPNGCYHIYTYTPPYPPVCQRLFCVCVHYILCIRYLYIIILSQTIPSKHSRNTLAPAILSAIVNAMLHKDFICLQNSFYTPEL